MTKKILYASGIVLICLAVFGVIQTNIFAQDKKTKSNLVYLTKDMYLKQIHNYEKNKTWVYEGKKPAIIDFYADWCGPCKRIAPIVENLAVKYDKKILVYKVDVDQQKELAAYLKISSIPMIMFIPLKGEPQIVVGAISQEEFEKRINEFLLAK